MAGPVFISYSRANTPFALRLKIDLERAGVSAWLDTDDIPWGNVWRPEIVKAIEEASHLVVLASPESAVSVEVRQECQKARERNKPVWGLFLAGTEKDLPADWLDTQLLDFRRAYWELLPRLLRNLGAQQQNLSNPGELLRKAGTTFRLAGDELQGSKMHGVAERCYVAVPVEMSAYTTTWLVGEADRLFRLPQRLYVLLKFTGSKERGETLLEVLEYLSVNGQEAVILFVQGPRDREGNCELPLGRNHVWEDGIRASVRAIQEWGRGRPLSYFLEGPQTLVFPVAAQLREMGPYQLYQLNRGAKEARERYQLVYERNPT